MGKATQQRHDTMARLLGGRRIPGRFGNHGFLGGYDVVYDCIGHQATEFDITTGIGVWSDSLGVNNCGIQSGRDKRKGQTDREGEELHGR